MHYSVRPLKGGSEGSGRVKLGCFGTASLVIDNAPAGLCFGCFMGAKGCGGSPVKSMILIFETPQAYSVAFDVTLSGDSASFSQTQFAGGYTGATYNGPNSVTVSVNAPYDDHEYVPVVVQGSGEYQVTTSIPVQVAPDNYSYVPGRAQHPGDVLARRLSDSILNVQGTKRTMRSLPGLGSPRPSRLEVATHRRPPGARTTVRSRP